MCVICTVSKMSERRPIVSIQMSSTYAFSAYEWSTTYIDRTISVYCISNQNFFPINNGSALLAPQGAHIEAMATYFWSTFFLQITLGNSTNFFGQTNRKWGKSLWRKKSAKQYLKGSWPKFESGSPLLTAGQVPPKPQLQHEELRQNLLPTSSSVSVGECWCQQDLRLSAFSCSSLHHLSPMRNLRKPLVSDAAPCSRSWNLSETKSWSSTLFLALH